MSADIADILAIPIYPSPVIQVLLELFKHIQFEIKKKMWKEQKENQKFWLKFVCAERIDWIAWCMMIVCLCFAISNDGVVHNFKSINCGSHTSDWPDWTHIYIYMVDYIAYSVSHSQRQQAFCLFTCVKHKTSQKISDAWPNGGEWIGGSVDRWIGGYVGPRPMTQEQAARQAGRQATWRWYFCYSNSNRNSSQMKCFVYIICLTPSTREGERESERAENWKQIRKYLESRCGAVCLNLKT